MNNKQNITGIILAGGKSSRMGSDKGFLKLNGSTFVSHIIEAIKPMVNEIIVVSNNSDYDVFNLKRVNDIIEDAGPLAGLYTGLFHSKTEFNLVLSCDIPFINTAVLKQLIEGFDDDFDAIQLQSQDKTMPLIAMYKRQWMHQFLKLLQNDKRRLRIAVEQLHTKTITIDSEWDQYVENINTMDQLIEIRNEVEH